MDDGTNTAHVTAAGDHGELVVVKLDVLNNAASLKVDLDCVVDLDVGVGVPDGAGVVCHNHGHATLANKRLCDLAKLELCAGTKGEEEEEEEGEEEEKKKEEEEEEKKKKEVVNKWSSSRRYRKHIKQEKD